ncbi:hypothetical protein ZOSMA_584G00010, partial [Zostera marina]
MTLSLFVFNAHAFPDVPERYARADNFYPRDLRGFRPDFRPRFGPDRPENVTSGSLPDSELPLPLRVLDGRGIDPTVVRSVVGESLYMRQNIWYLRRWIITGAIIPALKHRIPSELRS